MAHLREIKTSFLMVVEEVNEWGKYNGNGSLFLSRVLFNKQMCLVQIISEKALFSSLKGLRVWIFIFLGCSRSRFLLGLRNV